MHTLSLNENWGGRCVERANVALEHLCCSAVDGIAAQSSPSPFGMWSEGGRV